MKLIIDYVSVLFTYLAISGLFVPLTITLRDLFIGPPFSTQVSTVAVEENAKHILR